MDLLGEFTVSLDVKGRFLLPNEIKKSLGLENSTEQVLYLKRGIEKCLELLTPAVVQQRSKELNAQDRFDEKVRRFRTMYMAGGGQVGLDSIGRILLPKKLIEYAGLKKEIVLVGTVTEIEIWDSETYNKLFYEGYSPEQFSVLAKEVMGVKKEGIE